MWESCVFRWMTLKKTKYGIHLSHIPKNAFYITSTVSRRKMKDIFSPERFFVKTHTESPRAKKTALPRIHILM